MSERNSALPNPRSLALAIATALGASLGVLACAGSDSVDGSSGPAGPGPGATGTGGAGTGGHTPTSTGTGTATGGNGGVAGSGGNGGSGGVAGQGGNGGQSGGGKGGEGGGGGCENKPELCNGLDDNCNNQTDEGDPGGGGVCVAQGRGQCKNGTKHCQNGAIECVPADPVPEQCNGFDDDCDGQSDEGDPGGGASCMAAALGQCKFGTEHCSNGSVKCAPAMPSPEVCDGLDNNCEGNVDEGNPGGGLQCMTGLLGLCATGVTACDGVNGVVCQPSVTPGQLPESCNGLDDNCNGLSDENIAQVGQPCNAPGFVGICQFGTYVCPAFAPFQLTCNHPAPGTVQETCNALDDDCNGTIDDPGLLNNLPCASGVPGVCSPGHTLCSGGSSTCIPNVAPGSQTEICDSQDNNCNGQTDEMNPTPVCQSQNPAAQFVQAWACTGGNCQVQTCQAGHANINNAPADGCECTTDSWSNACNVASTLAVPLGGSVNMIGKIETAAGSDWVTFNFTATGVGAAYHPKVSLTDSGGGQYAMDVMASCAGAAGCSTTGGANNETGINVTTWEQTYSGYVPGAGCCADNTPRVTSVKVRIFRKNGGPPTCASYTVTATNT